MKKLNIEKKDLLTACGAVGVVATTVSAIKATSKVEKIKAEKIFKDKKDEIRHTFYYYIPTMLLGVGTVSCIFGINKVSKNEQTALLGAYSLLDNSYKQYREKVNDIYGEGASDKVMEEIVKDNLSSDINSMLEKVAIEDDERLFFDMQSGVYFTTTLDKVIQAEKDFEAMLSVNRRGSINEFYELLELEESPFPWTYGWNETVNGVDPMFRHHDVAIDDDLECIMIVMENEPWLSYA